MSGIKISELTETQSIQGGCCFPLVSGNDTKKITYNSLKAAILSELGDYVVDEGKNGNWYYRKWNSGFCELYYSQILSSLALTTATGNLYRGEVISLDYPFNLTQGYDCSWNLGDGGTGSYDVWFANNRTFTTRTSAYPFAAMNTTRTGSLELKVSVKGRWK